MSFIDNEEADIESGSNSSIKRVPTFKAGDQLSVEMSEELLTQEMKSNSSLNDITTKNLAAKIGQRSGRIQESSRHLKRKRSSLFSVIEELKLFSLTVGEDEASPFNFLGIHFTDIKLEAQYRVSWYVRHMLSVRSTLIGLSVIFTFNCIFKIFDVLKPLKERKLGLITVQDVITFDNVYIGSSSEILLHAYDSSEIISYLLVIILSIAYTILVFFNPPHIRMTSQDIQLLSYFHHSSVIAVTITISFLLQMTASFFRWYIIHQHYYQYNLFYNSLASNNSCPAFNCTYGNEQLSEYIMHNSCKDDGTSCRNWVLVEFSMLTIRFMFKNLERIFYHSEIWSLGLAAGCLCFDFDFVYSIICTGICLLAWISTCFYAIAQVRYDIVNVTNTQQKSVGHTQLFLNLIADVLFPFIIVCFLIHRNYVSERQERIKFYKTIVLAKENRSMKRKLKEIDSARRHPITNRDNVINKIRGLIEDRSSDTIVDRNMKVVLKDCLDILINSDLDKVNIGPTNPEGQSEMTKMFKHLALIPRESFYPDDDTDRMIETSHLGARVVPKLIADKLCTLFDENDIALWNFDTLGLSLDTEKNPIFWMGWRICQKIDLLSKHGITNEQYSGFLHELDEGYSLFNNPYHNSSHGADVMHNIFYLLVHRLFHKESTERLKMYRGLIIKLVLITDLADHFRFTSELKNVLQMQFGRLDKSRKELLLKMVIKISDIGHGAKSNELHVKWSKRISEEFYQQGDHEMLLYGKGGISPFYNGHSKQKTKEFCKKIQHDEEFVKLINDSASVLQRVFRGVSSRSKVGRFKNGIKELQLTLKAKIHKRKLLQRHKTQQRLLFLSCDGVLNTRGHQEHGLANIYKVEERFLSRLVEIVRDTGCKLVLCTVLRYSPKALRQLKEKLYEGGLTPLDFIGQVDRHPSNGLTASHRLHEILTFLAKFRSRTPVETWAILDSYDLWRAQEGMNILPEEITEPNKVLREHFVKTIMRDGLNEERKNKVIGLLLQVEIARRENHEKSMRKKIKTFHADFENGMKQYHSWCTQHSSEKMQSAVKRSEEITARFENLMWNHDLLIKLDSITFGLHEDIGPKLLEAREVLARINASVSAKHKQYQMVQKRQREKEMLFAGGRLCPSCGHCFEDPRNKTRRRSQQARKKKRRGQIEIKYKVSCPKCTYKFCWNCGIDYRIIEAHGNHYHHKDCRGYKYPSRRQIDSAKIKPDEEKSGLSSEYTTGTTVIYCPECTRIGRMCYPPEVVPKIWLERDPDPTRGLKQRGRSTSENKK
eukprot:g2732.t1